MAISNKSAVPSPAKATRTASFGMSEPVTSTVSRDAASVLTPDLCVIGAGSGGLSVAAAALSLGVSVVLIEKHKMGGDCLNSGCVPSKALIAAAERAHRTRTSAAFGVTSSEPKVDFKRLRAHIQDVIAGIAPNDSAARFAALGGHVIQAAGRFVDPRTVKAGDTLVRARRFVIATGSSPALPAIPGLESVPYLTNETIFDLDQPIGHLLVIGGGAIGLELAQAYRRLGARVTIVESQTALAKEDPELTAVAVRAIRAEGVVVNEGMIISRIGGRANGIEIEVSKGETTTLTGTHLLIATGRKPNVDGLGLQAAGIKTNAKGIVVNAGLFTSNRRVYAVGDVNGGPKFTHAANYDAGIVVRRALFRLPVRVRPALIPRVTFTDPEVAQVGLTEAEARAQRLKIAIYRWPFSDNDRARAERTTAGLVKVVCDRRGRILGAGIVGPRAGELIHVWSLAITEGLEIGAMTRYVVPYPTLGEVSKRAAMTSLAEQARRPGVRKLLSILKKFG